MLHSLYVTIYFLRYTQYWMKQFRSNLNWSKCLWNQAENNINLVNALDQTILKHYYVKPWGKNVLTRNPI